ncbi:hypothetical protein [Nonomuraea diastatica]|uniref:Uncharacterized protein n=1 Tax=Nonomuraea diastatica TaxID=1848329 RepID=A0A4R4W570_9ACTN|nr:hypothetical protein [Nonomuraea diastatica]TDD13759.1 hypothetical protein E1294_39785 [Nonomuraea diastatica]
MNHTESHSGKAAALDARSDLPAARRPRPVALDVAAGAIAALAAAIVAILTFGVQATVAPHEVPLGVVASGSAPGASTEHLVDQLAAASGEAVSWRRLGEEEANDALVTGGIMGFLTLSIDPGGGVEAKVTTGGTAHPNATAAAEQMLRQAATAIMTAAPPVATVLHPVSAAGRVIPLALVSVLWIAGMVGTVVARLLRRRAGIDASESGIAMVIAFGLIAPAVMFATVGSWESGIAWTAEAIALIFLIAMAFSALHGALARLLGWASLPLISLIYLIGAPMATQPPELLAPAYRVLAWSWSPLRITVDQLRALLFAPQQSSALAVVVLGVFLLTGLLIMLLPQHPKVARRTNA